jgi:Uma2 family endonuclease
MVTQPVPYYTPEEYLEIDREAEVKSEYLDGQIYAMAGASPDHNVITANILGALVPQLRGGDCRGYASDLRVLIEETGLYTYPDVTVVCGPRRHSDDRRDTLVNPTLIVEVLSPSTEIHDRVGKFSHYRRIESLQEYVLVSQHAARIERYLRRSGGEWLYASAEGLEAALRLDSIGCELRLADVYDGVEFEAAPADVRPA